MGAEAIQLGTCNITFNSVDLGLTIGGVEVEVTTNTHKTMVDQFGETVVAERITGRNCIVRVPMAEVTLDNLVAIMPGATKIGTDPYRVDVATGIGTDLLAVAQELKLTPIGDGSPEFDFIVPKAMTPGAMSFSYKIDEERVFVAEFQAYPDATDILFSYGDALATV